MARREGRSGVWARQLLDGAWGRSVSVWDEWESFGRRWRRSERVGKACWDHELIRDCICNLQFAKGTARGAAESECCAPKLQCEIERGCAGK